MAKLLQLVLSSKSGMHRALPGARSYGVVLLDCFKKFEKTEWHQSACNFSNETVASGIYPSNMSILECPFPESNIWQSTEVSFQKNELALLNLDLSAASFPREVRSSAAPLASHGWQLPPLLGGRGQGLPAIAVRHHMGGGDHHHGPATQSLSETDKSAAKAGERISRIGLGADVFLTVGKGAAGWISGSTAIIADAAHSVSDIALSAVTLWSVRTGSMPADKEHPYGHGKFEALGAFGISAVLLATGGGIAWHALEVLHSSVPLQDLLHALWDSPETVAALDAAPEGGSHAHGHDHDHHEHSHGGLFSGHSHGIDKSHLGVAVGAAVTSIGVKESLFWATKAVGERTGSSLLEANAWHHRSDAVSSMVALVGVGGAWCGVPWLDPMAGLLVSGMILRAGTGIAVRSVRELTDTGISEDELAPIRATVLSVEGVEGCHALRGRRMGSRLHIDLHIQVDPGISVGVGHDIGDAVKARVREAHRAITDIFVHVDPADGRPITLTPAEAEASSLSPGPPDHHHHNGHRHHYHTRAFRSEEHSLAILNDTSAGGERRSKASLFVDGQDRKRWADASAWGRFRSPWCEEHRH